MAMCNSNFQLLNLWQSLPSFTCSIGMTVFLPCSVADGFDVRALTRKPCLPLLGFQGSPCHRRCLALRC